MVVSYPLDAATIPTRMINPGTVLFATDTTDAGISDARAWIKAQGYTGDDVSLRKTDIDGVQMCVVIAKRQWLEPKAIS